MSERAETGRLLRVFPAMESRDYRRLFYAAGLSAISLWALITARGWLAYDISGNASATGIVTFAAIGPWVLAPIGGALADRFDRARIVMFCRAGACLMAFALMLLAFTGTIALWNLVLITAFSGVIRSAEMPAQMALLPNTVAKAALLSAITLASMMQFGSKVIGPVAGPVLSELGAGWIFLAAGCLLALSVWQMTRISVRSTGGIAGSTGGVLTSAGRNINEGLRYLGQTPSVRLIIVLVALHCMLTMAFDFSLLPAYADRIIGGGSTEYGYLLMSIGGGALASTVALSMLPAGAIRGRLLLIVGIGSGGSLVLLGFAQTLPVAIVGGVIAGSSQAMFMALTSVMIQQVVPDAIRGRVMSLYAMFAGGIMAVMILANGLAADYISIRPLLVFPGLLFAIAMVLAMIGLPRVREIVRHGGIAELMPSVAAAWGWRQLIAETGRASANRG